jgi:hypothetical protein
VTHTFLATGHITASDIQRITELTIAGHLSWKEFFHHSYEAWPTDPDVASIKERSEEVLGRNLRGVQLYADGMVHRWNTFEMKRHDGVWMELTWADELFRSEIQELAEVVAKQVPDLARVLAGETRL